MENSPNSRNVFVVHGRNLKIRDAMFEFLRELKLFPLEWSKLVASTIESTGRGNPYVGEVLDRAFKEAKVVVVLLTPDDLGRLRDDFCADNDPSWERELTPQARLNVVFEAGMAIGHSYKNVIVVEVGKTRPFSDFGGLHVVKLDNSKESRGDLAHRLNILGCPTDTYGSNYLTAGNFDLSVSNRPYKLEEPFDEKYNTVKKWFSEIRKKRSNKINKEVPEGTKIAAYYALRDYCNFLQMTPDDIIEDAKNELFHSRGVYKHNDYLDNFVTDYMQKHQNGSYWNESNSIRGFYSNNGITLTTPRHQRPKKREMIRSIDTDQLRKVVNSAPLQHASWILMDSYLGLGTQQICLLKAEDFNVDKWKEEQPLYPVHIRKEVNESFEYTTFIGQDAKNLLERYFARNAFKGNKKPWDFYDLTMTTAFKLALYKANIIGAPNGFTTIGVPKGYFEITPLSLRYRLFSVFQACDVPPDWIALLTGHSRFKDSSSLSTRPNTKQLYDGYMKALEKLTVFPKPSTTLANYY